MGSISFTRLFGRYDLADYTGAACSLEVMDPDLWYSEETSKQAVAVRVCGKCPIKDACLLKALDMERELNDTPQGVWGGQTAAERRELNPRTFKPDPDLWEGSVWEFDLFEEDQ